MPIYEYQCQSCGHELEKLQRMSDDALTDCPECGKDSLRRLVSAAGFRLKGGGWYADGALPEGASPEKLVIRTPGGHVLTLDDDGGADTVGLAEIRPGDRVRVDPGESIPVDGIIDNGTAWIREAEMTGEGFAVVRRPGDTVWAGTHSLDAGIVVRATSVAGERRIDAIIDAIEQVAAARSGGPRPVPHPGAAVGDPAPKYRSREQVLGLQQYVADLNRVYVSEPALYERDCDPAGFEWIDLHDSDNSILCYLRRAADPDDYVVIVCNFTPVPRFGYRVGVPEACVYRELLNSDAAAYWGSNLGNAGGFAADPVPWQGQPYSLNLTLAPLSVSIFKPSRE